MSAFRHRYIACLLGLVLAVAVAVPGVVAQTAIKAAFTKVSSDDFPTVVSHITVIDDTGKPVVNVPRQSFAVFESGRPVQNFNVVEEVDVTEPLNVVLAIDTSGSMAGRAIQDARAAATTFVQGLKPVDKAAVISFAWTADLVHPFTDDKEALTTAIGGLRAVGATALYDAVILASRTLATQPEGRRAIVVLSDGEDTISKATLEAALTAAHAARAPVFIVGLGPDIDRDILNTIADASGGTAIYAPNPADLQAAFQNITDLLRKRYVLTFDSSLLADNRSHPLLVRVRAGTAEAEAKGSFVAKGVPPELTIVSPTEGQTVQGLVPVEVQVRAAGEVRRVEAIAAGFRVGSTDAEPYLFEWDTRQLASGRHTLDVTVLDSLGNRATKQVAVLVEAAARPTPVPPPTPAPAAVVPQQPADYPLLPGGLAVLAVLLLAAVVVRRRSRPSRRLTQYKDTRLSKCPTCGGRLKRGLDCPVCRAEDDKLIQRRLRELAGKPPEDEPEREGQP